MERKRNSIVRFPTARLRDALRVTAIVTVQCQACGQEESLDVIGLVCTDGPAEGVQEAVELRPCARCGERGAGIHKAEGGPALPRYALHLSDLIEPAYTVIAQCEACHRQHALDVLQLAHGRGVGPDARLADVARRMRCEGCGQRGWTTIRIER